MENAIANSFSFFAEALSRSNHYCGLHLLALELSKRTGQIRELTR